MNKKIDETLSDIWKRSRFTSYFFQGVDFVETPSIPTLALNLSGSRMSLHYNPRFTDKIDTDRLTGLLVHEMLHVVMNHSHRGRAGDDPLLKNISQDMVINSYIRKHRKNFFSAAQNESLKEITLPPGLPVIPDKFFTETGISDPAWEDVYRWLKNQSPSDAPISASLENITLPSTGSEPDSMDPSSIADMIFSDKHDDSENNEIQYDSVVFKDKSGDTLPAGMHVFSDPQNDLQTEAFKNRMYELASKDETARSERVFGYVKEMITEIKEVDSSSWQRYLKSVIDYTSQSSEWEYTHSRFNRRYAAQGIYAAGRVFKEQQLITVAVDLSASVTSIKSDIEKAFGAVESLLGKYRIRLVCIDEDLFIPAKENGSFAKNRNLEASYYYKKGDWKLIETGSGGSTFFAPLFNEYMKGRKELLIVITDGYIYDLHELKRHTPCLWVISSGRYEPFNPPFGRVVKIDNERII